MKRTAPKAPVIAAFAAAVFASVSAHAADPGAAPSPEFTRLDANRDGLLSEAETAKLDGFARAFREADDNRDGRLDPAEFAKAQAIHDRLRAERFVDDSVITAKVKALLLKDPLVSAIAVSVETHKGTVLLSGFVPSPQHARRAAEIAAGVEGVVAVKNGIVVKG